MKLDRHDPILLTPGPLNTAHKTKEAMLHDWGARDSSFIRLNREVCRYLLEVVGDDGSYVCVPIQGSGTFAIEAMLGTLLPPDGKLLILINGAYGHRMARICGYLNRPVVTYEVPEDKIHKVEHVDSLLRDDPTISHVSFVHCETTSGILNPMTDLANVVNRHSRSLLIDTVSSFGALPIDCDNIGFTAIAISSNKCIEGVPGVAFVICKRDVLAASCGNANSLCLDLFDQWQSMLRDGQWRFTPPTHVLAAFHQAILGHSEEGGVEKRHERYSDNCRALVDGMRKLGFVTLLPDELQAPIIVTFRIPNNPLFKFSNFYEVLRKKGYVIYPGKLTNADSFRIGCIGNLDTTDINKALLAVRQTLDELGIKQPSLTGRTQISDS